MTGPYTIQDLETETGIPRRTIYYYRTRGILPPPLGAHRWSTYTDEHLRILREVRRILHDERVTLADLAERYQGPPDA